MEARICVLPGDGVGPEVTAEAVACLKAVAERFGHRFHFQEALIGGAAVDATGDPLPEATLELCRASDAVLLGAVGGPAWDKHPRHQRPESGLLRLRKALGLYANLRPVTVHPALEDASPLKPEVVRGTDVMFVRELSGGLYFGEPRSYSDQTAVNTLPYTRPEIERVAKVAFELALGRRNHLVSVDKANVLETSRLWRQVVDDMAPLYPEVKVQHAYVDSFAMALITKPREFDVVLTENLFGDILSDEAAVLAGSLGLLPSASLGGSVGVYEPIHGSAPDIAGQDRANPIGTILSAAMLLRHALNLSSEAQEIETAVHQTLQEGHGTGDLKGARHPQGTRGLGACILQRLGAAVSQP
ncbi:3-isopropylmalate dehydrogenase [Geothrix sp. PMB-07]|uniref:3-isopropylmalate dehydrogenase n=1 Tax=Geothrix sp. PMB-07 TaxID=3068640 RepID=UPI0027419E12|nr:3-isopropylmalate dehydrogenase [Geothrix sp. PMB-07]WLT30216.1 3-isopropylmalate dehydrogenase [Geothrix sp. PMB-07]